MKHALLSLGLLAALLLAACAADPPAAPPPPGPRAAPTPADAPPGAAKSPQQVPPSLDAKGDDSPPPADQSDLGFDRFASLATVALAWKQMDAGLMTDAALQFAEGERVLARPHKAIQTSQVFDLAIRLATETKDKAALDRIAKALEKSGDKDRLERVAVNRAMIGAARSADNVLKSGSLESLLAIRQVQDEVSTAKVGGDKAAIAAVGKSIADLPLSDKQRVALAKFVKDASESLADGDAAQPTIEMLDQLAGVSRGATGVKCEGPKFVMPQGADVPLSEAQFDRFLENAGRFPQVSEFAPDSDRAGLDLLRHPSRTGGTWAASGGAVGSKYPNSPALLNLRVNGPARTGNNIGIWGYTNQGARNPDNTCGQAAVATLLTYHNPVAFKPLNDNKYVLNLESGFPPDTLGGVFGTSWQRMEKMARANGLRVDWIRGTDDLKYWVRSGYPVIVMLDIARDKAGWDRAVGGHWAAVYAYDASGFYLTNWQNSAPCPNDKFGKGWSTGKLTWAAGTQSRGLLLRR